jgi:hypothetical protein
MIYSKHGYGRVPSSEYQTYQNMLQRCYNPKATGSENLIKQGIEVDPCWLDKENGFMNFIKDMGRKPGTKYLLKRINKNENYGPSNCEWVTKKKISEILV